MSLPFTKIANSNDRPSASQARQRVIELNRNAETFLWLAAFTAFAGIVIYIWGTGSLKREWSAYLSLTCGLASSMYILNRIEIGYYNAVITSHTVELLEERKCARMQHYMATAEEDPDQIRKAILFGIIIFRYDEGVNTFEKSFRTYYHLNRSLTITYRKLFLFTFLLLFSFIYHIHLLAALPTACMSIALVVQSIRLSATTKKMKQINENYERVFSSKVTIDTPFHLSDNSWKYEKIKVMAGITIPENIIYKMNPSLLVKWEETKTRLNFLEKRNYLESITDSYC